MISTPTIRTEILIIFTLFCAVAMPAFAKNTANKPDSIVNYKLNFIKNDTMYYRAVSDDSISFLGQPPLIKERAELYQIICDSVGKNGHFYLSQVLINFASKESSGEVKDRIRTESSWIGRKVWYEIDSVGNRYRFGAADSLTADVSPGGAFQPNLFFPFKESQKKIGESWIVESLDDLPENCIPAPLRKQTSIFRALPSVDTLGAPCEQFQYTMTAQGSVQLKYTNGQMLRTNAIIAQFGKMKMNAIYMVPHHLYATAEVKLTLKLPDGKEMKGMHHVTTNYYLVEIHSRRAKPEMKLKLEDMKPAKSLLAKPKNRKK